MQGSDLRIQIEVYDEEENYDREELDDRFNAFECDINDVESIFRVLVDKTRGTTLEKSLLGLMQSLLTLGLDADTGLKPWLV